MSDDYWKNRKKWDQIHGRGEYAKTPGVAAPKKPPEPRAPLVWPDDKDAQIALLRAVLKDAWTALMHIDANMVNHTERAAEFQDFDSKMREIGILPPKKRG